MLKIAPKSLEMLSVDLIYHVDRMIAESTDTGDPPPRCGIVPPPFRFLIRPRPSDFRQAYGGSYSKKSSDPPPRDGVRPLAFFRVAIVQGSS